MIEALSDTILERADRERGNGATRHLVAIVGAPGSGKSMLADALAAALGEAAQVVAMDGFHRDNDWLDAHGLRARKGAPETFDVAGFTALLTRLRAGEGAWVPGFDRASDAVVERASFVPADRRILLVEGNYLLLERPGWRDLAPFWDFSVLLDVPEPELERRLMARWRGHGMDDTAARAWIVGNDLPNIRTVRRESRPADLVVGAVSG